MERKIFRPSIILLLVAMALLFKGITSKQMEMSIVAAIVMVIAIFRMLLLHFAANYDEDKDEVLASDDNLVKFLKRDKKRHVEMLEVYRRGNVKVLYEERDGVLFYDYTSDTYYGTTITVEGAQDIVALLPPDYGSFIAHSQLFLGVFEPRMRIRETFISYNYVYTKKDNIKLPKVTKKVKMRRLQQSHREAVLEHYAYARLSTEKYISERIEEGMLGAFIEDKLVGFIGIHDNGALGMLYVYEDYRGEHIAEYLQASFVNKLIADGYQGYIYAQVRSDSETSEHIQKILHFDKSEHPNVWYFG
ncbi:MAG: GNAT family N-acetyltransferase [Breznakia sp.]